MVEPSGGPPEARQHHLTQTVLKALDVLECLAASRAPLSAQDVAQRTGLSRTTAYRLLTTMTARGYVVADPDARFRLGIGLLRLGSVVLDRLELPEIAQPEMRELTCEVGETTFLGVIEGGEVLYLARVESPQPVRLYSVVGTRNPLHCTALGKAMLAFLPAPEREALVRARPLEARTPRTLTDPEVLLHHLEEVRRQGYAVDDVENEEGVRCVAAPIFGHDGRPVAAISVSAPAYRLPPENVEALSRKVRRATGIISARLGATAETIDAAVRISG